MLDGVFGAVKQNLVRLLGIDIRNRVLLLLALLVVLLAAGGLIGAGGRCGLAGSRILRGCGCSLWRIRGSVLRFGLELVS